jgi:hypothetical protein
VIVNVNRLPRDLTVPSFGPRMVCTRCGIVGADARPQGMMVRRKLRVRRSTADALRGDSWPLVVNKQRFELMIAGVLVEHASESGRASDALFAIRQAEAIVKALELAGYEIKPRT